MKRIILPLLVLAAPAAAQAERFAIACEGTATFTHREGDGAPRRSPVEPMRQVYVIDEEAETVHRALEPRQEFEDLCIGSGLCFRSFSPGLILVDTELDEPDGFAMTQLMIDRRTGAATYEMDLRFGRRETQTRWEMQCERTEIPVFDTSRNRF